MKNLLFLVSLLFLNTINGFGQTNVFPVETMGSVAGTTAISAHTGWVNNATLTFSAGASPADVRSSIVSTGYPGASANANVFFSAGTSRNLIISNINTSSYTGLTLTFGVYKGITTLATSSVFTVEVSTDGVSYSNLSFTDLPAGTGTAMWFQRVCSGVIPSTSNLRIRFTNLSGAIQFRLDDVQLQGTLVVSNTISAPATPSTINLSSCASTDNINVNVTSTGTFTIGNQYTAQLSDASGSFTTPLATASVTDNTNTPPTIVLTVPAATPTGSGYLVRVISNNPSATGTSSGAFTINQGGSCVSVATDYFRSRQTGNWNLATNWESSPDNITWINATLVPTSSANAITVQTGHNITMTDAQSLDQTNVNGTLTLGTSASPTIADGTGTDLTINGGGILELNGTANTINITFTGTVLVNTNGILRYTLGLNSGSIAQSLAGTTTNAQIVYANGGIFEWNNASGFSFSNLTYFSTSATADIPIFRVFTLTVDVGGLSTATINGVLDVRSNFGFVNGGQKIFRNGIIGTGTITQGVNAGKLAITGTTAELSGVTLALDDTNGLSLENNGTININNNLTMTAGKMVFVSSDLNLNGKTFLVNGGTIQEDLVNNFTIIDNTATTELSQGGNVQYSASVTNTATNFLSLGLWLNHNGSGDYTINVKRRHYAAGYGNAITRIYDITGTPTGVSTIGINYASSELGLVTTPLKVSRWESGSGWVNYDPTTADYVNRFVTYNNVTGFSSWTLSSATISLPVSLVAFEAKQTTDNQANITWTTATEINNKQFEIWKSIDGFEYYLINTKDGQGNYNQIKNYNFIDNQFNESSYYQLKQIDNNGQINNVGLKFLPRKSENNIEIYPNPITEKIYIRNQTADLSIIIFDNIGRKIIETTNQNELQTQLDLLPKGIYTAQFRNKNGLKYQILVKN